MGSETAKDLRMGNVEKVDTIVTQGMFCQLNELIIG